MTLVNAETGEVLETCTPEDARELTDRIKVGTEAVWHLIVQAYQSGAHRALGYSSWDDYCTREFGTSRIRLPREERQEVVASLRDAGLSIHAIAAVSGIDRKTVRSDMAQVVEIGPPADDPGPNVTPIPKGQPPVKAPPKPIIGIDGKSYPQKPKPAGPTKAQRLIDIRQLAGTGHNAEQIARQIGLTRAVVMDYASEAGITLHDRGTKSTKHDANRIVRETVGILDGAAFGVRLVELDQLDPTEIEGWVTSLSDSLKSLNSFIRQLKEMTR